MRDFIALVLASVLAAEVTSTSSESFFPEGAFADELLVDNEKARLVAEYLKTLGEAPLVNSEKSGEVYRFLWIPPFDPAVMVRASSGPVHRVLKIGILPAGREGTPVVSSRELGVEEWETLQQAVEEADFWSSLRNQPREQGTMVIDPSYWILEGVSDGHYKIVQRAPPEMSRDRVFIALALTLLETAGFDLEELGLATGEDQQRSSQRAVEERSWEPLEVAILKVALDCPSLLGRRVTIMGAAVCSSEGCIICPTRGFLPADPLNCLLLELGEPPGSDLRRKLDLPVEAARYVMVEGSVACDSMRAGTSYGGTLQDIGIVVDEETGEVIWSAAHMGSGHGAVGRLR